jgi:hypothetical protein
VAPPPALCSGDEAARPYTGATSRPIAHRKAAISRAIAATTTGSFLAAASRRYRAHGRTCAFQAMSRTALGSPSSRALRVSLTFRTVAGVRVVRLSPAGAIGPGFWVSTDSGPA